MLTRLAGVAVPHALAAVAVISVSPADAKTVEPTPRQAPALQSGPAPPGAVPAKWRVHCNGSAEPIDCQAHQSVYRKATGERLVSVVVQIPRLTRQPVMRFQLPLGIDIASGASVQIGKGPATTLALKNCDRDGCFADYAMSQVEIAALIKGERLRISVRDRHRTMVRFRVSGAGFAEAYAKLK